MQEIIRSLFRGNLDVLNRPFSESDRQSVAFSKMENMTEQMKQQIPQDYHDQLRQYEKSMMDLLDAACEDEFLAGYRLGVRMLLAAWPESK